MTESDFEIEYLDEDEDVVQQCVQTSEITDTSVPMALSKLPASPKYVVEMPAPEASSDSLLVERPPASGSLLVERTSRSGSLLVERTPRSGSLLVERTPVTRPYKRKKPREDDDSDYDPTEDIEVPGPRRHKKRLQTSTPRPTPTAIDRKPKVTHTMSKKEELKFRRALGLKIPNFEDPLCLPVKAVLKDESDTKKLKNWNNLCLNHFRNHDTTLKPDIGETVGSQRTVVLRNVKNKLTGKSETTIWGKLTAQSETDKKSEVFQSVLPKYRESKLLDFPVTMARKTRHVRNVETAVLTKEDDKGDVLVVYKPKQALSALYKLVDENGGEADVLTPNKEEEKKQYLKELTVCKVCAPCYQGSWRGYKKTDNTKKSVVCPICARSFVSVYNLLAHVKTHSSSDVRRYKTVLCGTLAGVVQYHYKCRICNEKCPSIKDLRRHVLTHQSMDQFQCEVCNKVTKSAFSM